MQALPWIISHFQLDHKLLKKEINAIQLKILNYAMKVAFYYLQMQSLPCIKKGMHK